MKGPLLGVGIAHVSSGQVVPFTSSFDITFLLVDCAPPVRYKLLSNNGFETTFFNVDNRDTPDGNCGAPDSLPVILLSTACACSQAA
jgi:hypothetical protein